jgi:hypothetical protein
MSPPPLLEVTVFARHAETLNGLEAYFRDAGVRSRGSLALPPAPLLPNTTAAVVLFPDDFPEPEVVSTIQALRDARPSVLLVVVTGQPKRLGASLDPDGRSLQPVLLAKPAFGWNILDAVRLHAPVAGGRRP